MVFYGDRLQHRPIPIPGCFPGSGSYTLDSYLTECFPLSDSISIETPCSEHSQLSLSRAACVSRCTCLSCVYRCTCQWSYRWRVFVFWAILTRSAELTQVRCTMTVPHPLRTCTSPCTCTCRTIVWLYLIVYNYI